MSLRDFSEDAVMTNKVENVDMKGTRVQLSICHWTRRVQHIIWYGKRQYPNNSKRRVVKMNMGESSGIR